MSKYIGSLGGAAYDPKIFSVGIVVVAPISGLTETGLQILPRDDEDDDRYEKAEFDRKEFKLGAHPSVHLLYLAEPVVRSQAASVAPVSRCITTSAIGVRFPELNR